MSVVPQVKTIQKRVRSASSPAKHFVIAPAADSVPLLDKDTNTNHDDDGSLALFTAGIDRLNNEFKNALMV